MARHSESSKPGVAQPCVSPLMSGSTAKRHAPERGMEEAGRAISGRVDNDAFSLSQDFCDGSTRLTPRSPLLTTKSVVRRGGAEFDVFLPSPERIFSRSRSGEGLGVRRNSYEFLDNRPRRSPLQRDKAKQSRYKRDLLNFQNHRTRHLLAVGGREGEHGPARHFREHFISLLANQDRILGF